MPSRTARWLLNWTPRVTNSKIDERSVARARGAQEEQFRRHSGAESRGTRSHLFSGHVSSRSAVAPHFGPSGACAACCPIFALNFHR